MADGWTDAGVDRCGLTAGLGDGEGDGDPDGEAGGDGVMVGCTVSDGAGEVPTPGLRRSPSSRPPAISAAVTPSTSTNPSVAPRHAAPEPGIRTVASHERRGGSAASTAARTRSWNPRLGGGVPPTGVSNSAPS